MPLACGAYFKTVLTFREICAILVAETGESVVATAPTARGRILREYHGNGGFGYDPLFFYPPFGKTFAELSAGEKNAVSHRGQAMRLFAAELKRRLAEGGTGK